MNLVPFVFYIKILKILLKIFAKKVFYDIVVAY